MTPPSKTRVSRRKKSLTKWGIAWRAALGIFGASFLAATIFIIVAVATTPEWDPNALHSEVESSIVYDMNGDQIAQLHKDENRVILKSEEIPDLVKHTFVAVEDRRFYQHFGVDPIRIGGAAINDIISGSRKEGASTITIQLAKNAFIENPTDKSFTRKIREAVMAIELERNYTKDEILTFYLNKISFGESSFGIQAASQTYFGKDVKDLNPGEIALLAGLPQAPSRYDPYINPDLAKNRRNIVLGVMNDQNLITEPEYNKYKEEPFTYVEKAKDSGQKGKKASAVSTYKFPYFIDYVIEELVTTYDLTEDQIFFGGLKIYTTVDPKIQEATEKAFANPANFPASIDQTQVEGAMTIIEPSTGAIRGMVGGREYTPRGLNRAWQAKRQPGSSIKPLTVYGPAIEKGGYYPGTVLDDMPAKYNAGNGKVWAPANSDHSSSGLITMRRAIENSVNVYAVKLLDSIGVNYGWKFGKDLLGLPLREEDKVLSLALGTTHVSTLDMASAYSVYANNGVRVTYHSIEKVLDSEGKTVVTPKITKQRVMKETTAYIMNDLLSGVVTRGTGTNARIGNWAIAGKTGTTSLDPDKYPGKNGNPDAWFAGYTSYYTGVVWMGYDKDPDGRHYLSNIYGGTYPARMWSEVMKTALADKPLKTSFSRPAGIVSGNYDKKSGLLPSSLTPKEFIDTEIAAQGDFPTKVSDIWVEKEVDADNPKYLATDETKNRLKKVFLNITDRDPEVPWPADELPYQIPKESAPSPKEPDSATPPLGDPSLPIPALGTPNYDTNTGTVTIPLTRPADMQNKVIIIYIKYPDQAELATITIEDPTSESAKITLSKKGVPPETGEYVFWAAVQDKAHTKVGSPSESVKINIPKP